MSKFNTSLHLFLGLAKNGNLNMDSSQVRIMDTANLERCALFIPKVGLLLFDRT